MWIKRGALTAVLIFGLSALAIAVSGSRDDETPSDVAVVLGSQVLDGHPSPRLEARLTRALELYQRGVVPMVLVSGGMDSHGADEAVVMQRWLVKHGVPGNVVLVDSRGRDTWATAKHTAEEMQRRRWKSVTVVSQYFHVPRSRLALHRLGIEEVRGVSPAFFELRDVYSLSREVLAVAWYAVRA